MKKHLITSATAAKLWKLWSAGACSRFSFAMALFILAGLAASAQNTSTPDQIAARLAAQRAAENGGGDATPAATTPAASPGAGATNAADANAANADDTDMANSANTGATNAASTDPDEIRRLAALEAAKKEVAATANLPTSLASLQIITHNNIFDPRRQPWTPTRNAPPVARVETFTLRGVANKIGKGPVAMFVGDGVPPYPQWRCVGQNVSEFVIKEINDDGVKLADPKATNSASAEIVLGVEKGQQGLTRADGGPWKPAYFTPTYASAPRGPSQPDQGFGGGPQFAAAQPMAMDNTPSAFTYGANPQDDGSGGFNNPRRQRGQGGPGGGGGRQRGGGGGFGNGGFGQGGGGGGNSAFAPAPPPVDPNAPIDPIVLQRLQQRRQAEQ
jgi:uncharacterized membrane protein YgcG